MENKLTKTNIYKKHLLISTNILIIGLSFIILLIYKFNLINNIYSQDFVNKINLSIEFLAKNFPFGRYGFGIWQEQILEDNNSEFIYSSYPVLAYWTSSLLRKILPQTIDTFKIFFVFICFTYLSIPIILGNNLYLNKEIFNF